MASVRNRDRPEVGVAVALLRGRRRVAHITAKARAGRNLIRLRAPSYRLQVLVATADGQRATDRARLTVSRR